ncbi:MAG: dTMP kinase [Comamonadaceae bacterium]|nr:MAG: dTMP kinase [Comamonadaceae bacterium]
MTGRRAGRGWFVTLEGIDGAGKSSHLDAIEAAFVAAGHRVRRSREPGGTPLGETLRTLLLNQDMDALTESLLVFAARREHVLQVIEPALAAGDVLLCDRFTDATFAYQGAGRGFDLRVLETLERWVQGGAPESGDRLEPDLTLWFDLPAARLPDKFEAEPVDFFRRVASGYAARAAGSSRFERIDAARPLDQVRAQVLRALRTRGLLP